MPEVTDLLDDPEEWREREVLEELWLERDWTMEEIADALDELTTHETVSIEKVRYALKTHNLRKGPRIGPTSGLAAKLLSSPKDAVGGDPA